MAIQTFKATTQLQNGMVVKATSRHFEVTIDEPKSLGGTDTGMNPVELVLCALGGCQAIVARVYAKKFEIDLQDFRVELEGDLDTDGFMHKADVAPGYLEIRYNIFIKTNAAREQVEKFIEFVEKTCPVGDTIARPVKTVLNNIVIV
ncbi:OsmC family protein [Paenibacillus yanchengensis]|uniref:OsmC family protein n=1 Tax=Paenibacillus yanchengensis TaxID=2035833 RepID=A0ABW4YFN0_9BACL